MLDDDPPGQSGGTGGNKSGSRAGHQRLPVVHRDQGLAGRVRMAERSTKTLLSAVSTTAAWIYDVAAGRRVGWHACVAWLQCRGCVAHATHACFCFVAFPCNCSAAAVLRLRPHTFTPGVLCSDSTCYALSADSDAILQWC